MNHSGPWCVFPWDVIILSNSEKGAFNESILWLKITFYWSQCGVISRCFQAPNVQANASAQINQHRRLRRPGDELRPQT
jgi:hypothetical protein